MSGICLLISKSQMSNFIIETHVPNFDSPIFHEQLRNLAKDVQVDPDLRGKAIHYLGQDYSGENVITLNSFLSDQDPGILFLLTTYT